MTKMIEGRHVKGPMLPARETADLIVRQGTRLHEGFFNLDSYPVSHRRFDGAMTPEVNVEVFERGDSVGVLLYNRDTDEVVVVQQFRLPTLDLIKNGNGRIVETVAGMVAPKCDANGNVILDAADQPVIETPAETAIRETYEETGYLIHDPEPVAAYFSSPGGTTERIFLFFAVVTNNDKKGPGGGTKSEDIGVTPIPVAEFSAMLRERQFVDPKLVICAYYMQARFGMRAETEARLQPGKEPAVYRWKDTGSTVAFKTGDILAVEGVDIWLNPENRYMMMARVIDDSLSASIRWGGAEKYSTDVVAVDTIGNALRRELRGRAEAADYEIIETEPGDLAVDNGVRRLLHLPVAEARGDQKAREGLKANKERIKQTIFQSLMKADEGNRSLWQSFKRKFTGNRLGKPCSSVLMPLAGTGQGGLTAREAVPEIVDGIVKFFDRFERRNKHTYIQNIFLLALYQRDVDDCKRVLDEHPDFTRVARQNHDNPA